MRFHPQFCFGYSSAVWWQAAVLCALGYSNRPIRPQLDFALRAPSRCRASALCMLARRFVSQSSDQTSARFRTSCFISLWGVRPMHDKKGAAFCKLCLQGCTLSIMRRSDLLIQTVNYTGRRRSRFGQGVRYGFPALRYRRLS